MATNRYTYTIETDDDSALNYGGKWYLAIITDPRGNTITWRRQVKTKKQFERAVKAKMEKLNNEADRNWQKIFRQRQDVRINKGKKAA